MWLVHSETCAAHAQRDGRIHARQFFHHDGIIDVAVAGAAQFLRKDRAQHAQLAQLRETHRAGKCCDSSHSITCGLISAFAEFANGLAKLMLILGESEIHAMPYGSKRSLPVPRSQRTVRPEAIAIHGHAARDRDAIAEIEGTVRLLAGADAIEEILHVRVRQRAWCGRSSPCRRAVHFLRNVAHLAGARNAFRALPSTSSLDAQLIVAEARSPTDQNLLGLLQIETLMVSGTSRPSFHR